MLLKRPGQLISGMGCTTRMHSHQMCTLGDWDRSREGGRDKVSLLVMTM